MKQFLVLILFIFSVILSHAQVETRYYTKNDTVRSSFKYTRKNAVVKTMPSFNLEKLRKEDAEMVGKNAPCRFGKGFDVSYTLADGQWEDIEGGRLWTISFKSEGALSLNYIFDNFYLPEGASLYIENQDGTVLYGPVTSEALSKKYDSFLTDIIQGDQSTIYLFEPLQQRGESSLVIKRVIHGYRGIIIDNNGIYGRSASCNYDVACVPVYEKESNAVAFVLFADGDSFCSGSLIMNTDYTFEPYFLTAFHCVDSTGNGGLSDEEKNQIENGMFKFCYKKTSCSGSGLEESLTFNKADFCCGWYKSDYVLFKLRDAVSQYKNLTWLGWDRTGNTPTFGACIHHPDGDVMKVSIDYDAATSVNFYGQGNAWQVDFDYGITQPGSSGAPLLNQSRRIVGQLFGGDPQPADICDWTVKKFGKFSRSWDGSNFDEDKLKYWLDPINTGQTTIDSYHPFAIVGNPNLFTQEVYQLNNLPSGWTVSWSFSSLYSYPSGLVQSNTPSTNQCTLYNPNKAHVWGVLTATIYKSGGGLYGSVHQTISTGEGFTGTYEQVDNFNLIPHNIPQTSFPDGESFTVGPKCDVYIRSTCLPGTTITHTGANLNYWNYSLDGSYGVIHLRFPYKTTNQYLTIKAVDNTNSKIYEFYLVASAASTINFSPNLSTSSDGQRLNITMGVESEDDETAKAILSSETVRWDVMVCNAVTGKVMCENHVEGWSQEIDTTGWPSGVYVIKAQAGEHFVTQKVAIK